VADRERAEPPAALRLDDELPVAGALRWEFPVTQSGVTLQIEDDFVDTHNG
jgi:hypothetical protein